MTFELAYPEFLLLGIPAYLLYRRYGQASGVTKWLRIALLTVLLICLCGPQMNLGGYGIDVIAVVDRSRSMPEGADANIRELLTNLDRNRGTYDNLGIVTFGLESQYERGPQNTGEFSEFTKEITPDGSDIEAALEKALSTQNPNRPVRILLFSDGQYSGASPTGSARRARELSVPIDYRAFETSNTGDAAVESIDLPRTVTPREPFQFSAWIYADKPTSSKVTVKRGETVIATTNKVLNIGRNRLLFRDLIDQAGFFEYSVTLEVDNDPILENNTGIGSVRVESGPRVLLLNNDGEAGNLGRAMDSARIPYDVAKATEHPMTQDSLDLYRTIILENAPAGDLGRLKMERIAQFVEDLGGGLLVTGGQRSFGQGGYFKSPLDPVLPVSMELREEHRKTRVAFAIALDRSGSMTAPVKGGKVKMDLADLGAAECIRLLSPGDSVSLIAVDSSAHIVIPMTDIDDPVPLAQKAMGIQSEGGGIYVYEALMAAGTELMKADQSTKHIILFSDAQDSEEPGNYQALLKKFEAADITVSVIGLGKPTDVDSELLKDIAKLGRGNILFTEDAEELPRLFTEDAMSVARSNFIEADPETQPDGIPASPLNDLRMIGELNLTGFPTAGGYNLSYIKPEATMGIISQDEYNAPWAAYWYRGLGRVAALTFEVDGKFSGNFGKWDQYEPFLVTNTRWLLGGDNPKSVYLTLQQDGQDALATLELDPNRPAGSALAPELLLIPPGDERIEPQSIPLEWIGPDALEARAKLNRTGTYRTIIKTGPGQFQRGPALSLPYSPEFAPRIGLPSGQETLQRIAELSGGRQRTDVIEVFKDPPRSPTRNTLIPYFLLVGLGLLVTEIAGRRLQLWSAHAVIEETSFRDKTATWLLGLLIPRKSAPKKRSVTPVGAGKTSSSPLSSPPPKPTIATTATKPTDTGEQKVADAFSRAKKRAQDRR
ncbi:VWA domain-containing protein [Lacunimicrobium album]